MIGYERLFERGSTVQSSSRTNVLKKKIYQLESERYVSEKDLRGFSSPNLRRYSVNIRILGHVSHQGWVEFLKDDPI
jgi:hypothetical protein